MKICPQCRTTYTDDELKYCLQDGAKLVPAKDADTETPTVVLNNPNDYETNKNLDKMRIDVQHPPIDERRESARTSDASYTAEPKSSKTLIAVLATVLAMLLIFAGAVGAWFYFAENDSGIVQNTNKNKTNSNNKKVVSPPTSEKTDSVKITPTAQPTASQSPPDFDSKQVKKEVADKVNSWKNAAESLNLDSYMNNYAETVDYYNKKNANINFVRRDKQKAFSAYDNIEMKFGNIRVTPTETGEKAIAVFDKQWNFSGAEKSSEGKVQTQLNLAKIGGEWKITGEKDLKVYYVKQNDL